MGTIWEAKYGPIEIDRETGEGEPGFLFRAQDALAPMALEAYAGLLEAASLNPFTPIDACERAASMATRARDEAARFRAWQAVNVARIPD